MALFAAVFGECRSGFCGTPLPRGVPLSMQLSFLGMELMSYVFFAICTWHALKVVRSKQRFLELVVLLITFYLSIIGKSRTPLLQQLHQIGSNKKRH